MLWPGVGKGQALLLCTGVHWQGSLLVSLLATAGLGWLDSAQVLPAAEQGCAQVGAYC